jgi:hypothetical protein
MPDTIDSEIDKKYEVLNSLILIFIQNKKLVNYKWLEKKNLKILVKR